MYLIYSFILKLLKLNRSFKLICIFCFLPPHF